MSGKTEQIEITVDREEVEQLLKSIPTTMEQCVAFTHIGLMEFCGNQHNEAWRWVFSELKKVYPTTQALYSFYKRGKLSHGSM